LIGLITAIGLMVFLVYWLCTRSNNVAIAKAVAGLANALAHRPKSPEAMALGENRQTMWPSEGRGKKSE
jgi:hypothetical protein